MADVTIDAVASSKTARGMRAMVWTNASTGYFFFIDADADFKYIKTTDGGASWGGLTTVFTGSSEAYDVWFDQLTPGDSGTIIHTWYIDADADDVFYRTLDTTTDTLGTQRTVFAGASVSAGRGVFVSGAKMRGGNLLCCFDIDAGAETGTYRSTDAGVNWGARTNLVEATIDQALVFPGNESDANDGLFLYQDASTDELTTKVHDDSANTNAESAVIMTLAEHVSDAFGQYGFSGSIRHSDGHLIATGCSALQQGTDTNDFRVFDINGTGSITEKTALATDAGDIYYPRVYIDPSDNIYIGYIGNRDGSGALGSTTSVQYAKSTDGGTTWSSGDTAYSATGSDWIGTWAAQNGPRWAIAWRDFSSQALATNFDNSVAILPKGGGLLTLGVGA